MDTGRLILGAHAGGMELGAGPRELVLACLYLRFAVWNCRPWYGTGGLGSELGAGTGSRESKMGLGNWNWGQTWHWIVGVNTGGWKLVLEDEY